MLKRGLLLTIEGNIGAGKSYLLATIQEKLKNDSSVIFAPEPVEMFSRACFNGKEYNPLKLFYSDPKQYAFTTQNWILQCYKKQLEDLSKISTERTTIIMDRGIYATTLFTESSFKQGFMTEFQRDFLLQQTNEMIEYYFGEQKFGADKVFFLDTPYARCMEGIRERDRPAERNMQNARTLIHLLEELYHDFLEEYKEKNGRNQLQIFYSENYNAIVKSFMLFKDRFET